ncbi:MAG: DUF4097 family beta strand repeat protein [Lachnospiraceae bacterium]|jgi:hypothetical protein|nr:DUF4097 family beta strand repeat protein [Lachnospiraceae bacterium]
MKKFTKVCLMIAGGMGIVGCLLCLISVIGGGGTIISYAHDDYVLGQLGEKGEILTRKLRRLTGHADEREFEAALESASEKGQLRIFSEQEDSKNLCINGEDAGGSLERQIDTGEVQSLSLLLGAGSLTLSEKEAGEGESIDLYIQGEGKCDFYVKDGTLYIEGFKGNHVLGTNFGKNNILLKLPMGMRFDEVEIEVGAGVMEAYKFNAKEIKADVGAGILSLYQSEAKELSVEIGAGEFSALDVDAREADLTVGLGNCSYQGSIFESLEAECDMGNMDFLLKGKESDYNYEIECSGGNIEMDSFQTAAFAMEKEINNGAAHTFELSCSMGNISLHFEEE